jgi:hypothetical protein
LSDQAFRKRLQIVSGGCDPRHGSDIGGVELVTLVREMLRLKFAHEALPRIGRSGGTIHKHFSRGIRARDGLRSEIVAELAHAPLRLHHLTVDADVRIAKLGHAQRGGDRTTDLRPEIDGDVSPVLGQNK